jgi:hypothetical protein
MEEKKMPSLKKTIIICVLFMFCALVLSKTIYSAQKTSAVNHACTEKTISSILSIFGGNHLTIDLTKPDNNNQDDDKDDKEKKKDEKKSESDPYKKNGNRTSKKKANSED